MLSRSILSSSRLAIWALAAGSPLYAGTPQFESEVLPILQANCQQCHGPKLRTKDLDLSTYQSLMKGSESGAVVIPGKAEESRLYKMVQDGLMPVGKARLSEKDVAVIRAWIE